MQWSYGIQDNYIAEVYFHLRISVLQDIRFQNGRTSLFVLDVVFRLPYLGIDMYQDKIE